MKLIDADALIESVNNPLLWSDCERVEDIKNGIEKLIADQPEADPMRALTDYFKAHNPISIEISRYPEDTASTVKIQWSSSGFKEVIDRREKLRVTYRKPYWWITQLVGNDGYSVEHLYLATAKERDDILAGVAYETT